MSRPITSTEIKTILTIFSNKKRPGSDGFTANFAKKFREEMSILFKFFQKIVEEGKLLNSFSEATIILIPKSDKDATKK